MLYVLHIAQPAALVILEDTAVVRCFGLQDSELTCPVRLPSSGHIMHHASKDLACLRWDTPIGMEVNQITMDRLMLISDVRLRRCQRNVCSFAADGVTGGMMLCVKFPPAPFVKSTSKPLFLAGAHTLTGNYFAPLRVYTPIIGWHPKEMGKIWKRRECEIPPAASPHPKS